jgi:hypothetical protein
MFDDAHIPEPPEPSETPDPRIAGAEARLRVLRDLREFGMEQAELATRRARVLTQALEAGAEPPKIADPGDVFARVFRGMRCALVLEARLEDDLYALRAGTYAPESGRAPQGSRADDPAKPVRDRMPERSRLRGHVLELTDPDSMEEPECERIYSQLTERLYESERYDLLLDLPIDQAIEAICKDLGIRPQYELWDGLDWPPWRAGKPPPEPQLEPQIEPTPEPPPDPEPAPAPAPAPIGAADGRREDPPPPAGVPPHPPPYGDTG